MLDTKDGVEYLDKNSVHSYIKKILSEAEKDGNVSQAEILRLDAKGLEIDGKKISNMIAAIGDDARKVSEIMHFTGEHGAINDALNRIGGEYGDKNAISSIIDALGKLDQDSDGITKISEILDIMAKVDSGAADVLEEDADAIELIKTMAESANVPIETFLNTLSEVGLTKGYIGNAFEALTNGLGGVEAGFAAASSAAAGYQETIKAIEDGGEKDSSFTVYTEAYDKFQEQVKAGTTNSNAFWESAEFLLGGDKLRELKYNSAEIVKAVNGVKQAYANDDNGVGFLNYVYGKRDLLVDPETGEQLIDIKKSGNNWEFDFDTENLEKILPILNMTEEGFYACVSATEMWMNALHADPEEMAEKIDQLGVAVETTAGKFVAADTLEDYLKPTLGDKGAYEATQSLTEFGYTLVSVKELLADTENGATDFVNILTQMGVASDSGDGLTVGLDDMTKSLTEMGMTTSEIESLLGLLGQIEGVKFTNATGEVLSLEEAIAKVTRGEVATRGLPELVTMANESAAALQQLEGNEDLEIKMNVSDIESTEDKIEALDGTISKIQKMKTELNLDASDVEHANNVIAYCVVQKQLLSQPDVMAVDTSQVEGDLGNALQLLIDFQNLVNTRELYLSLGMTDLVEGKGGINEQLNSKL